MAVSWIYPGVLILGVYVVLIKGQLNQCGNPSPLPPFCQDMPYNSSSFPNGVYVNMIDSQAAELEIRTFQPIVISGCSEVIREFLCSVYFPDCDPEKGDIPPCREVCLAARSGCEFLMNKYGFAWPAHLHCSMFPSQGEKLCSAFKSKMDNVSSATTTQGKSHNVTTAATTTFRRTVSTTRTPMSTTLKRPATTTKAPTFTTQTSTTNQCSQKSTLAPMCEGMPYNTSSFPNSDFQTSIEAEMEIHQYTPLIRIQCSDVLKEFLCSVYFPECDPYYGDIPPCKETCEYALAGCGTLMIKFGFEWPQILNCERFPPRYSKRCAYYESKTLPTTTAITTTTTKPRPSIVPDVCQTKDEDVSLPNALGHWNLHEARDHFESFHSMQASGCSAGITEYLCHVFFPRSTQNVKPCWEYCLRVRTQCLFQLPVPWPNIFLCESFPAKVTSRCHDDQSAPAPVANILQGAFRLFASLLSFATSS